MSLHRKCLVCSSTNLVSLYGYEKFDLVKCSNCNLVFIEKIPLKKELEYYYNNYGSNQILSPFTVKSYNYLLNEFEHYRSFNKILDVGTGMGYFLDEAKKRNWNVYGTELSESKKQLCINKGIDVLDLDLQNNNIQFDIITSFEVIEHLNTPVDEMKKISRNLRKGGLFYCTTPNFNSLSRYFLKSRFNIISYPEHLCYFTPGSLNYLITQFPFRKIKTKTTGISLSRIRQSSLRKSSPKSIVNKNLEDENLRSLVYTKWYFRMAKNLLNYLFSITGTGLTIKAYYEKI